MTPQTVNAVNLPVHERAEFSRPAILQPPFFDPDRPAAMDYGADRRHHRPRDQPQLRRQRRARSTPTGRLRNWWTPEDFTHFEASAEALVKQYDAYKPFPDLHVNGKQTLGENIADLAGLAAAYDAYQRLARRQAGAGRRRASAATSSSSSASPRAGGDKEREPRLRRAILTDGHAPDEYRAFTVRNLDAWYAAFDVKPGQTLYLAPAERVRVW